MGFFTTPSVPPVGVPPPSSGVGPGTFKNVFVAADLALEKVNAPDYGGFYGKITLATVISCCPFTGAYRIAPGRGTLNSYAIPLQGCGNRVYGTKEAVSYPPGTYVLVFMPGNESDIKLTYLPIILGAVNVFPLDPGKDNLFSQPWEVIPRAGAVSIGRPDFTEQIQGSGGSLVMRQDRSFGTPLDIIPGEWTQVNSMQGAILLNDFVALMKMSEGCSVECHGLDNSLRQRAEIHARTSPGFEERVFCDRFGTSSISGLAFSLNEGLGGLNSNPALKDIGAQPITGKKTSLWPAFDDQRGFFGISKIAGHLADGEYSTHRVPGTSSSYYRADDELIPATLGEEKRPDGVYRLKAAREISLEKTIFIAAPKEKLDSDLQDTSEEQSFERKQWDADRPEMSEVSRFGRKVLDEFDEHELQHNSLSGVWTKEKYWKVEGTREEIYARFNQAFGSQFDPEFKLQPLDDAAPHYEEPPKQATIKPFVDGDGKRTEEVKIFDVSSAIRQLEDGSIVISGGYGEEIRFYKGNIYYSCPGDIIEMPGRDKITFAPRHNIQKACKGSMEATGKRVSLASDGDLQITASSSGGEGTLLIENRSTAMPDITAFDEGGTMSQGKSSGGGVLIRSDSMVGMLSKHNYIGFDGGSNFGQSITQFCSGNVIGNFQNAALNMESSGSFSLLGMGGAYFGMRGNVVEMMCSQANMGMGAVTFTKGEADITARRYTGEDQNVNISTPDPSIRCKGDGIFRNLSAVAANIDQLATSSGDVSQQSGVGSPFGRNNHTAVSSVMGDLASNAAPLQSLFDSFRDSVDGTLENLLNVCTVFPESSGYLSEGFYLPMSTWQAVLEGGGRWTEFKVTAPAQTSMPFPGKTVWESLTGLKAYEEGEIVEKSLADDYVINTTL